MENRDSAIEDRLDIAAQYLSAKSHCFFFRPATADDEVASQHAGKHLTVHTKLRQREFQLVHIAVVANLLCAGNGFETAAAIQFDVSGNVGIPPVTVR